MGSNVKTAEVAIVLNSLQLSRGKDSTMTECSVESAVTESESGYSTIANSPVVSNDARQPKFTVWKMLEYVVLFTLIAMVWGLLALPMVSYYVVSSLQWLE